MLFADNTYTVSGARDHFRDQLRSGAVQIEPVKDFGNYFSVLPHHPDATARCAASLLQMRVSERQDRTASFYPHRPLHRSLSRLKNSESVPGFVDRDHHVSHEPASSRHFRSTASVVSGAHWLPPLGSAVRLLAREVIGIAVKRYLAVAASQQLSEGQSLSWPEHLTHINRTRASEVPVPASRWLWCADAWNVPRAGEGPGGAC